MIEEERLLRIGIITGAHGIDGRLKVRITTDFIERFTPGNRVLIGGRNRIQEYSIEEFVEQTGRPCILRLIGLTDRTLAEPMRGSEIYISREEASSLKRPLGEDEFLYSDLEGCHVYRNGVRFGRVTDIIAGPGGDLIAVTTPDGREHLIPFVASMVDTGKIGSRRLDIYPVDGLIED